MVGGRVKQKQRLVLALSAYAVIAVVAYYTLSETFYVERFGKVPMSAPVILLMVLFAFKSLVHRNETLHGEDVVETEGRE